MSISVSPQTHSHFECLCIKASVAEIRIAVEIVSATAKAAAARSGWEINWEAGYLAGIDYLEKQVFQIEERLNIAVTEYDDAIAAQEAMDAQSR